MRFLITGVSRGLGKALTEACLEQGHEVWGVSRTLPSVANIRFRHTQCDISDVSALNEAIAGFDSAGFVPDVFVFNAAIIKSDYANSLDMNVVRETFATNLFGHLHCLNVYLPRVLDNSKTTYFLNISTVSVFRALPRGKFAYPASKAAMDKFFEELQMHHKQGHLRFITFNLGPLTTSPRGTLPFLSASYQDAAQKILCSLDGCRTTNRISFPPITGLIYKAIRFLPDSLVRRITCSA